MKTKVGVRGFFFSFLPTEEAQSPNEQEAPTSTMEVEDGEDGASASRGEGGADAGRGEG